MVEHGVVHPDSGVRFPQSVVARVQRVVRHDLGTDRIVAVREGTTQPGPVVLFLVLANIDGEG